MSRLQLGRVIPILAALGWLFVVVFAYYIPHKPFTAENLIAVLSAAGDVLVVLLLFACAAAVGRRLMRRLRLASPLEEIVLHTGVGLGLVSFVVLDLGLLGWVSGPILWLGLVLGLVLLRGQVVETARAIRELRVPCESRFERGLALFVLFGLGVSGLLALTPPIGWDAIQYHLVGPQLALAQGRITAPPDNLSLSNPALVEMLFLVAMALKSDISAQVVHWTYLLLLLGAVMALALRYYTPRHGWLGAALLVAVPSLLAVSTWAYNDTALAYYATAALFLVLMYRQDPGRAETALVWAGAFAGMTMGAKYTAAFVVVALASLLFRARRESLRGLVVFGLVCALVASPWYLRNIFFTGNPIYPFVWGGPYWDEYRATMYARAGTGLLGEPLQLLLAPWEATVLGREDIVQFQATIGPLFLALVPLWLVTLHLPSQEPAPRTQANRALWIFAGVLYLAWAIGLAQSKLLSQTRLLFPAFPAFALLAAEAYGRLGALWSPRLSVQRFACLVVGLVLGLNALSNLLGMIGDHPLDYIVGFESRRDYLARHLGSYYTTAEAINAKLPQNAQILFLWETRSYYVQRAVHADAILDTFGDLRYRYGDVEGMVRALRAAGYTHILLNRAGLNYFLTSGYDPVSAEDVALLQELLGHHTRQVFGELPLALRDGAVLGAVTEPYAIYELLP